MRNQVGRLGFELDLVALRVLDGHRSRVDAPVHLLRRQPMREELVRQLAHFFAQHCLHAAQRLPKGTQSIQQSLIHPVVNGVFIHQVPDEDLLFLLADAVDPPNALLNPGRIPWQVVIDEQAGKLQVHPFGRHLGGQQDVRPVSALKVLQGLLLVHAAVQHHRLDPVARQPSLQVIQRGAVEGEQHHFFARVLAPIVSQVTVQQFKLAVTDGQGGRITHLVRNGPEFVNQSPA